MSVRVVVQDGRSWPLEHGRDPADLLAAHGLAGSPAHALLASDGHLEIQYHVTALPGSVPAPPLARAGRGARTLQRLAAYALVTDGDRLLLSRLARWVGGDAGGRWTLPGGGIEPGEQPDAAVVREVHEETGQHVIAGPLVQVQSMHHVAPGEDFHAVRLIHRAECPRPCAASVIEVDGSTQEAAWVSLGAVSDLRRTSMVDAALTHLRPTGRGSAEQ